jgi:hypothetical protein
MSRNSFSIVLTAICMWCANSIAQAQLISPQVGWQAELSTIAHNVSGTVSIVDENTIQVDDFTYDGRGISVYFYLGQADTRPSFLSGLPIGSELVGSAFNGSQPPLLIDLPAGETLEGWNAISVWCVAVGMSFGSGTFAPAGAAVPGDYSGNGTVDAADYVAWRNALSQTGTSLAADGNGDDIVDNSDYDYWRARFGQSSGGSAILNTVPEPAGWWLACGALAVLYGLRAARQYGSR